jgi:hypothetical protein
MNSHMPRLLVVPRAFVAPDVLILLGISLGTASRTFVCERSKD